VKAFTRTLAAIMAGKYNSISYQSDCVLSSFVRSSFNNVVHLNSSHLIPACLAFPTQVLTTCMYACLLPIPNSASFVVRHPSVISAVAHHHIIVTPSPKPNRTRPPKILSGSLSP
jgi:hypothetical protein